jgi:phytoene dehydrogenase-like protein
MLPLDAPLTGAIGLVLAILAHQVGWPFAAGGSQAIANALADRLDSLGGQIETGVMVRSLAELPRYQSVLFNLTPKQALPLAGDRFSQRYRQQLEGYRHGPGIYKIDFALSGPIPWRSEICQQAGTLHLGGTFDEIAEAEKDVWRGRHPDKPFVLLTQPTSFDPTRAPQGMHICWAYCHVPHGSEVEMANAIEAQIERFAPGFCTSIVARHTMTAREMQSYNPNYVGGDINGGVQDWRQFFTRPVLRRVPYRTSDPSIFFCSSATPPGGGVHGMSGYHAATEALKKIRMG